MSDDFFQKNIIAALIPSLNEEKNISNVINKTKPYVDIIIVCDDGSTDSTAIIAKELGANVIRHNKNMGYGAAIKSLINEALKNEVDISVTIDADGQHNPEEIPLFINEADADDKAGIIIGNRLLHPEKIPAARLYTNKFMSYLISALCRQDIPDTQCGYKLIKKDVLKVISIKSRKFEIESELLVKTAKAGFKINSIPIKSIYAGEKSKIAPLADTVRFIRFLIRTAIKK